MSLSLAMIVRNSENVLDRCLSSCYTLFDEIIIVDTGSTDKTIEIAKKYTDKIYNFKWIYDFSAARNFSFEKATSDFIMWLDDDDVIKPKDLEKIKNLDYSNKDMFLLKYEYSHDQFGVVECSLERERIVKRSLNLKWQKAVHEYLPLTGKQSREDISIHHYKQADSLDRNIEILERLIKKDPDHRNFFYLGKELADYAINKFSEFSNTKNPNKLELANSKTKQAIKNLERFVTFKDAWWEDVFSAYEKLADCYLKLNNEQKFIENIFKSIQIEPSRAEPYYSLGEFYESKKDWLKSIHYFETCLNVKRNSNLMSSYYPQFYTWKPALSLVLCYNNIGDVQKSYELNELLLKFRPQDKRGLDNKKILENSQLRKKLKDGKGKKLHFGCQDKSSPGYVNVNSTKTETTDEVFELTEIPYFENSISEIFSCYSLEHLSLKNSMQALKELFRVLQPSGLLKISFTDLEFCCKGYLKGDDKKTIDGLPEKQWYKKQIYDNLSGFSKDELKKELENIGFIINSISNSSFSTCINAVKPSSGLKIGWVGISDENFGPLRIRVLNVDKVLKSWGYKSSIVNYPEIINQNFDVAIIGKNYFDEHNFKNVRMLKQYQKTVFCDLSENILEFPWVKEIIEMCDKVICCSYALEAVVKEINPKTVVIEDAFE